NPGHHPENTSRPRNQILNPIQPHFLPTAFCLLHFFVRHAELGQAVAQGAEPGAEVVAILDGETSRRISATSITVPEESATARSMMFSSSRTFPGQWKSIRSFSAGGVMPERDLPDSRAKRA